MPPKPKATFGKYVGQIVPETNYLCRSDNNILKVESVTKQDYVWRVNLRYIQSHTKKGQMLSIVEFDFLQDVAANKFVKL